MGKIVELSSSNSKNWFQLKRHKKDFEEECDRISKLPDELICSMIISRLTFTEAARTSVLSHRWKTLWYFFSGTLDIDAPNKITGFPNETRRQAMYDYLSSMFQVFPLLSSPALDSFIVRLNHVTKVRKSYLDSCVQFMMEKRLKCFVLDTYPEPYLFLSGPLYDLPVEFYAWVKTPCGLDKISSLTSISLNRVAVSEDLIHHLLLNCPLLEVLRVTKSHKLLNLKFIGGTTLLKLKHLEILCAYLLASIELCTPNLLTFSTDSRKVKLLIKNAPKLVELSFSVDVINHTPESVSSFLPHLERLTLDFGSANLRTKLTHEFEEQNKLQHLTWKLGTYDDAYTAKLNSLMEAFPFLHKFTLVILLGIQIPKETGQKVTAKHPHQCLKVLEINGFTGARAEVKLVEYFIKNTTSLEKIILDVRDPYSRVSPSAAKQSKSKRNEKRALRLRKYLLRSVSLVIIN